MAFSTKVLLALFISSLFIHAALAKIVCEELPLDVCAFAIATSGKRCLLETSGSGKERQCRTSEVVVEKMTEYIETDRCVGACGVERNSVGISSDSLLEPRFMAQLCSKACYHNCPNIVDLYFNLAAGEGVFLPDLCEKARYNPHRAMLGFRSSGIAPGPESAAFMSANLVSVATPAPAPAPESFFM